MIEDKDVDKESFAERVAGSPAELIERTIDSKATIASVAAIDNPIERAEEYWKSLGPGLTTGAADDDPSGIATYSQTGAQYGFHLLWMSLFTFPFMTIVQEMCARIGLVTGRGLASNIRHYYPRWVLYLCTALLFVANTLNIGADLGAMAKAVQLLSPHIDTRIWYIVILIAITLLCLILQIFSTYEKYARFLKWLAMILLSYVVTGLIIKLDWKLALQHTIIPSISFNKDEFLLITAILGTTISPYLFFWQTSQEVEEEILEGKSTLALRQQTSDKDIRKMRIDVISGMFLSQIVMFFIIAVCAARLFTHGIKNITTAADAATALRPLVGNNAYILFALGIIGTGLLAVPVLAGSTSYAMSESFGWKYGLYRKLKEANAFYGVIIISTLIGLGMNFVGIDPIKALIYSAVANGLVAPVILILIVLLSSNKKVMAGRQNHPAITALGWIITGFMLIAGIATIISLFIG